MKSRLLSAGCFLLSLGCAAQLDSASMVKFIRSEQYSGEVPSAELIQFYQSVNNDLVWFSSTGVRKRQALKQLLQRSAFKGLDRNASAYSFVKNFAEDGLRSHPDSINSELLFTEAALIYLNSLTGGSGSPQFSYNGLQYQPGNGISSVAAGYCQRNELSLLADSLEPRLEEILVLERKLTVLLERQQEFSYEEAIIRSSAVSHTNNLLVSKLFFLGMSDSLHPVADSSVRNALRTAQKQFSLLNDGRLRATILDELNVPVQKRISQLKTALGYYRWLHNVCRSEPVIVVNIPAANLAVYEADTIKLKMRMIVGKPATPTPTLSSRAEEVIFYPYWNVPHNIAVNEVLPSIKENVHYIDANNFQVLNKQGQVLDPRKINWGKLNAANFPYLIRQSTGCDNALGIVKINFYNPFTVYLHDTPGKELFMLNKRFFSHGCMRMERPMEMIRLLLNGQELPPGIDTGICLPDQLPVTLKAAVRMPVVVWYNPAGLGEGGDISFFGDIYRKFK